MGDPHIDAMLIRWAGVKSYDEIGEMTGIAPLEVARRTKDALAAVGVLEMHERRVKLMMTLESIIAEVDTRKEDASNRDLGGLLNASRAAAATILKELREIEKSSRVDVNAITSSQGRLLGQVVDVALTHLRDELKKRYPTDDDEIDELIAEGITIGTRGIDSAVSD